MTGLKWGRRVAAATFLAGCAFAAPAPAGWADSPQATPGTESAGAASAAASRSAPARSTERRARTAAVTPTANRDTTAAATPAVKPAATPAVLGAPFASAPAAPAAAPRITRRPLQDMTAPLIGILTPYSDWLADYPRTPAPPMLQGALDLLRRSLGPAVGPQQRSNPEWRKPTALKLENALDTAIFVAEVHGNSSDPDSQSRVLAEPVSLAPGAIFAGSPNRGPPNGAAVTKLWLWITTPPVTGKPEYELVVLTLNLIPKPPPSWDPFLRPRVTVTVRGVMPPFDDWWALEPPAQGRSGGRAFFPGEGALFFATERTDEIPDAEYGTKDYYWAVTKTISKIPA